MRAKRYFSLWYIWSKLCTYLALTLTPSPNGPNKIPHDLCNEDIPSIHSSPNEATLDIAGPITRSRAKQLEKEIHSQVNANLMLNNQIMLNGPMLFEYLFQCS